VLILRPVSLVGCGVDWGISVLCGLCAGGLFCKRLDFNWGLVHLGIVPWGSGAGVLGMALRRGGLAVEIGDEPGKGALC
jgi:hypothetical protein